MRGRQELFDAHCHLQDERVFSRAGAILSSAKARGVAKVAVNGCSPLDWARVEALYAEHPDQVVPNFGLHPWFLQQRGVGGGGSEDEDEDGWLARLEDLLRKYPGSGLGEAGLDKSRGVLQRSPMAEQAALFSQQLRLARELGRPVSVHCVKAWGKVQECLAREGPFPRGVLLHSFAGPAEVVPPMCALNAFFSVSLSILRIRDEAKASQVLRAIPPERLLLETDSPDALCRPAWPDNEEEEEEGEQQWASIGDEITSTGDNGGEGAGEGGCGSCCGGGEGKGQKGRNGRKELNHPGNVAAVLRAVSRLTGQSEDALAALTTANARKLFGCSGA